MIEAILWSYIVSTILIVIALCIYGIVVSSNIVKKLIVLSILGDTIALASVVFNMHSGFIIAPIFIGVSFTHFPTVSFGKLMDFSLKAVDPLAQVFAIIFLTIFFTIIVLLGYTVMLMHHRYKTLDIVDVKKFEEGTRYG